MLENFYNPKFIKLDKNPKVRERKSGLEIEKQNLLGTKLKKESYMMKLYEDKLDGAITQKQFEMYNNKFSEELKFINSRIKSVNQALDCIKQHGIKHDSAEEILRKYKKISKLTRGIVDEFIEAVYVGTNDKSGRRVIDIKWKF